MPTYDGLIQLDPFLVKFEREVSKKKCFQALDWVPRAKPTRWWGTHKVSFDN